MDEMVKLTIDGKNVTVAEGTTILNAARSVGIKIPTLCYLKDINEIGACRVCIVEIVGNENLCAACNTQAEDGMEVLTNSPRVREARRINIELILSTHNTNCTSCVRNGNCTLQTLCRDLNITDIPFEVSYRKKNWDKNQPLIRDREKCIKCMRCVSFCEKVQSLGVWDVLGTGPRTTVGLRGAKNLNEANCSLCGQCITHCPVGALHERDDTQKVLDAIANPDKIVIAQVAPAVRSAWGADAGLDEHLATVGRMVTALKGLGFDYVFDTDFAADLTIMEEGSELLERLQHKEDYHWPMFTSCCPGWVRFLKCEFPEFMPNLSSAKSPQQMFGAIAKTWFAKQLNVEPEQICCVSIMPCVSKKYEADVPQVSDTGAKKDVDIVLTTRETSRMLRSSGICLEELGESSFDEPLGLGTGAGVIFGTTGGVMEAALRSAHYLVTGQNPHPDAFSMVRGMEGWKERIVQVGDVSLKVAVASGLGNARKLLHAIQSNKVQYDFVEIMACPGGCAGGGGQPITDGKELAAERGETLRHLDANASIRFSHENPFITQLYEQFLEKPLSHKSHELLHTNQSEWDI